MGSIEEQIAKLRMTSGEEPIIYQALSKKAPQVPPKPNKKTDATTNKTPLVPRSSNVKKYVEPQYCATLGGSHLYSNVPTGKVTLDDSVELQIKKEALEHRKMLLQRKAERDAAKYGTNTGANNGQIYENCPSQGQLTYANIAYRDGMSQHHDLPPPPPLVINNELPTDEFPPPPSPVSSSYSELRQATNTPPAYPPKQYQQIRGPPVPQQAHYGMPPQVPHSNNGSDYGIYTGGSSTYESIYEPINPRTPSQMSSRSNYSLYTSYANGSQIGIDKMAGLPKVSEVDALTDLLVQSMDGAGSQEVDLGICSKCGEKIVGENSGCTAMDRLYHIVCFTCHECQINLQGKPFYALDGKPLCEGDYLNTLEKCSVCLKPILERILRATGKPYHPQCFTCVMCHKSLDGIPFTVDATNQIHCIDDFHKKFAPRCCVCHLPIMPEPGQDETVRVVALDRSFHINCYKCEDCGLLLSSEAEGRGCYPLDDHVLCKNCNATRVQALTSRMTTEL